MLANIGRLYAGSFSSDHLEGYIKNNDIKKVKYSRPRNNGETGCDEQGSDRIERH